MSSSSRSLCARAVPAVLAALALLSLSALPAAGASSGQAEPPSPFDHLEYRNVGPVNMSGRVSDVEGVAGDPRIVWVGSASGGIWKSENGGLTFEPVFDDQPIASIGDLGVAPSNPDVVYAGTGEANARNSVSFGDGVYKTTDGGRSWRHLGLEGTRHVSRVLVHPTDPDTAWVGAMGSFFGPGPDRGVFRTTDGGATWEKVLYLDERHGVADMDLDPSNPQILYAALWHFDRKPWTHTSGSREGGVWRSVDGGDTWEEIGAEVPDDAPEGAVALPELMGRVAVKVAPSDPRTVYVMAESNEGTLWRSDDRGDSFRKVSDEPGIVSRGLYYTDLRIDPADANRVYAVSSRLQLSIDGGRSWERISRDTHVDYHSLWIDPTDPARMWQGQDGGIAVSYDRGATWEPVRALPIAQFYQVYADHREPFYFTGGGLQDNGTWVGPSRTREPAGILEDDWRMISFGDAYYVVAHPHDPDLMISESQGGAIVRTDYETRRQEDISPQPERADGAPVSSLEYRFDWNAPIIPSPHDGETVYFAGNVVFRSTDFGDTWEVISPDLTTDDPEKQGPAGGPVWYENTTAEYHTTIISFAESPAEPGVLWAGTDDGLLHVSRDAGDTWTNVVRNVPGVPADSPVSHVEPSRTDAGTAYAAFDRHMFDDAAPYLFRTEDFGATWERLPADGLPERGYVHVLREDPVNPDLLYAGTELGLFASWDRGGSWRELNLANLPTVAVHDLLVHPRENDLVVGTHGRALWILDDATPIQRWSEELADEPVHLFPVRPGLRFPVRFTRYGLGSKEYTAPNPPYGALITYSLAEAIEPPEPPEGAEDGGVDAEEPAPMTAAAAGEAPEEEGTAAPGEDAGGEPESPFAAGPQARIELEILDASGTVVRTVEQKDLPAERGVNRYAWDLSYDPPPPRREGEGDRGSEFFGPVRGPAALPGTYTARLTVDGEAVETPVEVRIDPLVEVSEADLGAAFELSSDLSALKAAVNRALRRLDVVVEESETRRGHLRRLEREVPDDLDAAWKERQDRAEELVVLLAGEEGKPFWSQGPALGDELTRLAMSIDGAFRAPTAPQREYAARLRSEVADALGRVAGFLQEDLPSLNERLAEEGIPPLFTPDAVAVPAPVPAPAAAGTDAGGGG